MNALTLAYLEMLLFYRIGNLEESEKWLRECVTKREFNTIENKRIKERVMDLKEILGAERKDVE